MQTARWYRQFLDTPEAMQQVSVGQIEAYEQAMMQANARF